MSGFWDKKGIVPQEQAYKQSEAQVQPIELDQEALAEITEPEYDVFDEEAEDMASVLSNANLRLEQGRLYQMIMNSDIFGETDADPQAIKNVTREIRKWARNSMEEMLGMRQKEEAQQTIVSSPFNDMEVTVLKLLASKMSKGATETPEPQSQPVVQAPPKKDGLTVISGPVRPKVSTPLRKEAKAPTHRQAQPKTVPQPKPQVKEEATALNKPIDQMTPQELAEYDKNSSEKHKKLFATSTSVVPHPTPQELEMKYAAHAAQFTPGGATISKIQSMINQRQQS